MRFLFAAKHPPRGGAAFGGVASWILTMQRQLELRGHYVEIWGSGQKLPTGQFDVGVFANINCTFHAVKFCRKRIFVTHGVVEDEAPRTTHNDTFYTSEEVCAFWKGEPRIFRQPIDLDFWKPDKNERDGLVFYSYRAPSEFALPALAEKLGLKFTWLKDVSQEVARKHLQRATLVCASGRAALEAMACGAPTMICDYRPYNNQPLVCADLDKARRYNYSGRGGAAVQGFDLHHLAMVTLQSQMPRMYVSAHHDASAITDWFLGYLQC
jgi:hypothetical protein